MTPDLRTIVTLARAVQARDPYAAGRSERVTRLAQRTTVALGRGAEHHAIAVGVVCVDIGKIGLPDRLLHGRGTLSGEDYATLRSYPAMSSHILGELELPQLVKEMARWHLERWDGNGGPDGLAGESIPIFARILAVADAVDATSFSEVAEQSGTPDATQGPVPPVAMCNSGVCPLSSVVRMGGQTPHSQCENQGSDP